LSSAEASERDELSPSMERLKTPSLGEHACRGMRPGVGAGVSLELDGKLAKVFVSGAVRGRHYIVDWGLQPGDRTSSSTNAGNECTPYNSKRAMVAPPNRKRSHNQYKESERHHCPAPICHLGITLCDEPEPLLSMKGYASMPPTL
jgi:hypothetical protein